MSWDRLRTLLLVTGWGLAAFLMYWGRQQAPVATEHTKEVVVDTSKNTNETEVVVIRTKEIKSDGSVLETEETRGRVVVVEERSQTQTREQIKVIPKPLPKHSISVAFKPDLNDFKLKPHELTYGYRVGGPLWLTVGGTMNREILVGLRIDF